MNTYNHELIGFVGGMGPLASTAFLSTMYDFTLENVEQQAGRFILYSDPAILDRSETLLSHHEEVILKQFVEILRSLQHLRVTKIIVYCITLHYLLPLLPSDLQELIISLVDTIFTALREKCRPHLLLCTSGTRQLDIFQNHPLWDYCANYIVLPSEEDQQTIHSLICQLKAKGDLDAATVVQHKLLEKYGLSSFISCCTEIHLLCRQMLSHQDLIWLENCIDPLTILSKGLAKEYR